jgi:phosphoribosyl-ATP pyrophosphohydrolase/phosphoribosyl-AMP cyclohydrolase/histidinol dehydrogenase
MSVPLLPSLDISLPFQSNNGLSVRSLAHIGSVYSPVDNLDLTFEHLQRTAGTLRTILDTTSLSIPDIVSLLDAGAAKAVVSREQLNQLEKVDNVDLDRLVLLTSGSTKEEVAESVGGTTVGLFLARVQDVELVEAFLGEYGSDHPPVYVSFETPTAEYVTKVSKLGGIPVVPASQLTVEPHTDSALIDATKVILAGATSDRADGLFTTLVTNERGVALGLVYSSEESVAESLRTGRGVYQSRKRGLWYKGESSGDVQELVRITLDCDQDCLQFVVKQKGRGFCHLATATCFGPYSGLSRLQKTLEARKESAPPASYTARLFNEPELLKAKILEEAGELCDATTMENIAFEAADLFYFALTKCIAAGVSLEDIEKNLDAKSIKVKRRKGDAKVPLPAAAPAPAAATAPIRTDRIQLTRYDTAKESPKTVQEALKRPSQKSTEMIMGIVNPIIKDIQERGDAALLEYTHKFDKATSLTSPVLRAPFPESLMQLPPETIEAIDISFENIRKFHAAQKEDKPLQVETMPGVVCSRFSRAIERVGLYVPGGTAVLPSTALMLGIPAMVAGCKTIVLASPPRADGSITPEIVYAAHKVGAESIVLAGGAQAVAAMAYGTESVSKVDKILGPGNQFVTAAKMVVSNDTSAAVGIDMPAGPSEVLVIADETAEPAFVAADLLSQAEHGVDSQVVLIAVSLNEQQLGAIEEEVHKQATALPRVDIVRGAIDHSVTLIVSTIEQALEFSNDYAPEHLILQVKNAEKIVDLVQNAGSVFIGPWTPESVGDYSAGVNHSLRKYTS